MQRIKDTFNKELPGRKSCFAEFLILQKNLLFESNLPCSQQKAAGTEPSSGVMVTLDLKGLFQPKWFCDSLEILTSRGNS